MNEQQLLDLARDAAWAGAAIVEKSARHVTGARVAFDEKASAIDLVTAVDRDSEHAIVAVLRRSGIAIVAEESGGVSADVVWYVDPLDGTTNYAHGHPFCAISIALVVEGEPRIGVVHAPMLGVLWSGLASGGATRKDLFRGIEHPLAVSHAASIGASLGATGFPYDRRTSPDNNFAAFAAVSRETHGVLRCGSASIDLALIADGTYDLFWERKLQPWDLAAGAALVIAAGGRVTDPWGGKFVPESGAIAASNGRVHDELLALIAPHQPERP